MISKLWCIVLLGVMSWCTVEGQTLPPDAQKLKEQYEGLVSLMDRKYMVSKLEAYRGAMNKYAAQNNFAAAAELQKVVTDLEAHLSDKEFKARDELLRMEKVSPEVVKQMKALQDEVAGKKMKEKKKMDKVYLDSLLKIQKKYGNLKKMNEALQIQKEISSLRTLTAFIGKWRSVKGNAPSVNEFLYLNDDYSAFLTKDGKEVAWLGYKSFRVSPEIANAVELVNGKGKCVGTLKMLSNYEIESTTGWKLRRVDSGK